MGRADMKSSEVREFLEAVDSVPDARDGLREYEGVKTAHSGRPFA